MNSQKKKQQDSTNSSKRSVSDSHPVSILAGMFLPMAGDHPMMSAPLLPPVKVAPKAQGSTSITERVKDDPKLAKTIRENI